jgi:hypothetical protein
VSLRKRKESDIIINTERFDLRWENKGPIASFRQQPSLRSVRNPCVPKDCEFEVSLAPDVAKDGLTIRVADKGEECVIIGLIGVEWMRRPLSFMEG